MKESKLINSSPASRRRARLVQVKETLMLDIYPGEVSCFAKISNSEIEAKAWGPFTPGQRITKMSGRRTSAGFTRFEMVAPTALVYLGTYDALDVSLVVFEVVDRPGGPMPDNWKAVYHRYEGDRKNKACLIHVLPGNAGRVVELDFIG